MDNPLTHPMFRPIFAEPESQDLPITVDVGNSTSPTIVSGLTSNTRSSRYWLRPAGNDFLRCV